MILRVSAVAGLLCLLGLCGQARADLAASSGRKLLSLARPAGDGAPVVLARLTPSFTKSFVSTVGAVDPALNPESAGAVHLASNAVFYAPLLLAGAGSPGNGMGPGGDGSVDANPPPPPPPPQRVPSPNALVLGVMGFALIERLKRRLC